MTPKCIRVVNVGDNSSHTFRIEEEGKLPLLTIMDAFGITRVELTNEPGILSFDIYGMSNVSFKFGDTISIRGVIADIPITTEERLQQLLDEKLEPIRQASRSKRAPLTIKDVDDVVAAAFKKRKPGLCACLNL
jgi:hypothetical protein